MVCERQKLIQHNLLLFIALFLGYNASITFGRSNRINNLPVLNQGAKNVAYHATNAAILKLLSKVFHNCTLNQPPPSPAPHNSPPTDNRVITHTSAPPR